MVTWTYVTGLAPAQVPQVHYLTSRLTLFELATLALIVVVVALVFRSLVAPLVVLLVAGMGYGVAFRGWTWQPRRCASRCPTSCGR